MRPSISVLVCLCAASAALAGPSAVLTSPAGDASVDGGVSVTVDPYGKFTTALVNPVGSVGSTNTTAYSANFLAINGGQEEFLDYSLLGGAAFTATDSHSAVSSFNFGDVSVLLEQQVTSYGSGARLRQTYTLTNTGGNTYGSMTRFFDGDLLFDGSNLDGAGLSAAGDALVLFDSVAAATTAQGYVRIFNEGGFAPTNYYQVDNYWQMQEDLYSNALFNKTNNTIVGDTNADNRVDNAYDVAGALDAIVILDTSETVVFTTVTEFGWAAPVDILAEAICLPGDANLDGSVDDADYTVWADNYNSGTVWTQGDFNGDGAVDDADYTIWADHYGAVSGGSTPTPAPPALAMIAAGALALLGRRESSR